MEDQEAKSRISSRKRLNNSTSLPLKQAFFLLIPRLHLQPHLIFREALLLIELEVLPVVPEDLHARQAHGSHQLHGRHGLRAMTWVALFTELLKPPKGARALSSRSYALYSLLPISRRQPAAGASKAVSYILQPVWQVKSLYHKASQWLCATP